MESQHVQFVFSVLRPKHSVFYTHAYSFIISFPLSTVGTFFLNILFMSSMHMYCFYCFSLAILQTINDNTNTTGWTHRPDQHGAGCTEGKTWRPTKSHPVSQARNCAKQKQSQGNGADSSLSCGAQFDRSSSTNHHQRYPSVVATDGHRSTRLVCFLWDWPNTNALDPSQISNELNTLHQAIQQQNQTIREKISDAPKTTPHCYSVHHFPCPGDID